MKAHLTFVNKSLQRFRTETFSFSHTFRVSRLCVKDNTHNRKSDSNVNAKLARKIIHAIH